MSKLRFGLIGLSKWSVSLTFLVIAIYVISAIQNLWIWSYVQRIDTGATGEEADRIDQLGLLITYSAVVAFVITLFVNGVWIYRASWNARQLQPSEKRISPGWAIGFYFVPFLNLLLPLFSMKQTWNSSHDPLGDIDRGTPAFINVWWVLWIGGTITGRISKRYYKDAETLEDIANAAIFDCFVLFALILASVLFIKIVKTVTNAQLTKVPAQSSVHLGEGNQ